MITPRKRAALSMCAHVLAFSYTSYTRTHTHTHARMHARTHANKCLARTCANSRARFTHTYTTRTFSCRVAPPPSLASVPKFHFTKLSRPHLPRPRLSLTSPQHNNTTYTRTIFILKLLPLRHTLQTPPKVGVLRA